MAWGSAEVLDFSLMVDLLGSSLMVDLLGSSLMVHSMADSLDSRACSMVDLLA